MMPDLILEVSSERKQIVIQPREREVKESRPDEVVEVQAERKQIVIVPRGTSKKSQLTDSDVVDTNVSGAEVGLDKKVYRPSETYQMVQEQQSGRAQIQVNPKTGAVVRTIQSKTLVELEKNLE